MKGALKATDAYANPVVAALTRNQPANKHLLDSKTTAPNTLL